MFVCLWISTQSKFICFGCCRESKTKVIKSRTFQSFNAQSFVLCLFNWISLPNKRNKRNYRTTLYQFHGKRLTHVSITSYRANKFSAILPKFNSPDGNPSNFRYCVLQKTLHLRTLKSWETHSEPEKRSREYNITNVILIKVNFIMVFVFVSLVGKNEYFLEIFQCGCIYCYFIVQNTIHKRKRDKKHRRILRLNFSDFPWKLRIKKSHRMQMHRVREIPQLRYGKYKDKIDGDLFMANYHNSRQLHVWYAWFYVIYSHFDNADNAVILSLYLCRKKYGSMNLCRKK